MSKKKNSRGKEHKSNPRKQNRHHIFWRESDWNHGVLRKLRLHPYCIVMIPRDTMHFYIHATMNSIPTPKGSSVIYVLNRLCFLYEGEYISDNDTFERRLEVLASLFDGIEQPTADALREQLALVYDYHKSPP